MRSHLLLLGVLLTLPSAVMAQQIAFSPQATEICLASTKDPEAQAACVGLAARACVKAVRGATEVEQASCANSEAEWWKQRMEEAYDRMMKRAALLDVEFATSISQGAPRMTEDLAAMQAAWQDWSEKRCFFEAIKRRGKPDRSVRASECTMRSIAAQALLLDSSAAKR